MEFMVNRRLSGVSTLRALCVACLLQAFAFFMVPASAESNDADAAQNYIVDRDASLIRIYVYRAGLLNFLGHDHLISTRLINGGLNYAPPPSADDEFKLTVPVDALVVDDPEQRKSAGGKFARPVTAEARAGTRRNMLSGKVLDAAHYPEITVTGHWLGGSPSHGDVALTVELRGQRRDFTAPVDLQAQNGRLLVTGTLHLLQSEIGITPLSIMGGTLKVADAVDIRFALAFVPAAERPPPH